MKTAVILPMFNEEDNAPLVFDHLETVRAKHSLPLSYIAINDGSQDKTEETLLKLQKDYPNLFIVSYSKNKGLGGALNMGIEEALRRKFDVLVFMDADLTHDGNSIPSFLAKIEEGYDLVLGSRFVTGGKMIGVPALRALISKAGNIFGKFLLRVPVRDFTTGYRAGRREVFEKITLTEPGFGIQLEETVKAHAKGFKLAEVPIVLTTRRFGSSKMIYNTKLISSYYQLFKKCYQIMNEPR
jgi:dolichol-phosphate mannosyltransferase